MKTLFGFTALLACCVGVAVGQEKTVKLKWSPVKFGVLDHNDILGETIIVRGKLTDETEYKLLVEHPDYLLITNGKQTGWVRRDAALIFDSWVGKRVMVVSWDCNLRSDQRKYPFDLGEKFNLVGMTFVVQGSRNQWLRLPIHGGTTWIDQANVLVIDKPIDDLKEIVESKPSLFGFRGSLAIKRKQFAEARHQYEEAADLDRRQPLWRVGLGIVAAHRKEYLRAINELNQAIERDDEFAYAYRMRALIWRRRGFDQKAYEDYAKAIKLDPDNPIGYRDLAFHLATTNDEKLLNAERAFDLMMVAKEITGETTHHDIMIRSIIEMELGETRRAVELISGARYLLIEANRKRQAQRRDIVFASLVDIWRNRPEVELPNSEWRNSAKFDMLAEAAIAASSTDEADLNLRKAILADEALIDSYDRLRSAYEEGQTWRQAHQSER